MLTAPVKRPSFVKQRRRKRRESPALPVRPLGHGFAAQYGPFLFQGDGHRTLIVGQRRTVGVVQLPGHAPRIGAQFGDAP